MKKDWRLWKFLKFGETGLGWDPLTGKLSCSDEWLDRKIKEKPEAKKFRNKSIDPSLEELWNQLFEDSYADGTENVAPSMDPNSVRPVKHLIVNVADEDDESGGEDMNHYESGKDVYAEYNRYDPRIKDLLNNDSAFWPDFMEGSSGQVPTQGVRATQVSSQGDEATQVPARRVEVNQVPSQGNGTKKLHLLQRWLRKSSRKTIRRGSKIKQSNRCLSIKH